MSDFSYPIVLEVEGLPELRSRLSGTFSRLLLTREPTSRRVVPSKLQRDRAAAAEIQTWAQEVMEEHSRRIAAAMGIPTHIMERDLMAAREEMLGRHRSGWHDEHWAADVVEVEGDRL